MASFEENVAAISAAIDEKDALIAEYRDALNAAYSKLSCLVHSPSLATVDDWPVGNKGDAVCLQDAFTTIRHALMLPEAKP